MMIGPLLVTVIIITASLNQLCSGSNFLGPENITRVEGSNLIIIRCQSYPVQTTPFWKINGTIYYFSDVPPPFEVSKSGREIEIPLVVLSLNGTSFQCFIPSSSGGGLFSSSIGVLTVTDNVDLQVPSYTSYPRPKVAIIHQNLTFLSNSFKLSWKTFNNERCNRYQLVMSHSCDVDSVNVVLINQTKEESIALQPEALSNFMYLSLNVYDEEGNQCEEFFLEQFQFNTGIITKEVNLCSDNWSHYCLLAPTCIEIPSVNSGRKTLVLALPFLPTTRELEDLLCPVHPLPGERCVNLLSCNRFRESAYANSIIICRRANNGSNLEMCFHNVSDTLNGTRLHFFYSDLHCHPGGTQPQSTRTYIESIQLLIKDMFGVIVNNSEICIVSNCNQDHCKKQLFRISLRDKIGCTTSIQNITGDSCTSFAMLQLKTACTPYHVKVEADNQLIYNGLITEIQGYANGSFILTSKCTCYSTQSTTSTRSLAVGVCAILGVIILTLLAAIIAVSHRNFRIISQ